MSTNRRNMILLLLQVAFLVFVVMSFLALRRSGGVSGLLDYLIPSSGEFEVVVLAPPALQVGDEFELTVSVRNDGEMDAIVDRILLPNALVDSALVLDVNPGSTNRKRQYTMTEFLIDTTLGPGETLDFTFSMQAVKPVDLSGKVDVKSGWRRSGVDFRVVFEGEALVAQGFQPTPAPEKDPSQLYQSVVKISARFMDNGVLVEGWSGSGSIVSADGLILTNAHVVLPDKHFPVDELVVLLTSQADQPPAEAYYAEVLQANRFLDIAVIRITRDLNGYPVDPGELDLPTVPLGDSDRLELGEPLLILGYPGIGGETITLTSGSVSGFTAEAKIGDRAFIKTNATMAGGNSGGLVADEDGRLVAIPTQLGSGGENQFVDCRVIADTNRDGEVNGLDSCVPTGGFINALRPVALAIPMIEAAARGERSIIEPPTPEIPLPNGRVTLFEDDFMAPDAGWTGWGEVGGFAGVKNAEYQIYVEPAGFYLFGRPRRSFGDTVLSAKIRIITPAGDGDYGLVCRFQDPANFYAMTITEDGYAAIWKFQDGEFSMLLDWTYSRDIPKFGVATITAACITNKLTLAVNDVVLGEVTDYTFNNGDVGLIAGTWQGEGLTVAFDDFLVQSP